MAVRYDQAVNKHRDIQGEDVESRCRNRTSDRDRRRSLVHGLQGGARAGEPCRGILELDSAECPWAAAIGQARERDVFHRELFLS